MVTPTKNSGGARRLDESGEKRRLRFPAGLSGFGQRWEDREFDADEACRELLELVDDLPSLRRSARELAARWLQAGRLGPEQVTHMEDSLGKIRGLSAVDETRGSDGSKPARAGHTTDPLQSVASASTLPQELTDGTEEDRPRTAGLLPGDLIAGRYQPVRRLEDGSMGVIFQAIDLRAPDPSNRYVALKLLSDRLSQYGPAIRALQQEAQTGRLLDHPRIVKTYGLEQEGSLFFIVMEWLPGVSLARWMKEHAGEPMTPARIRSILADAASALSHAHSKGITHADVKPGNIMLHDDGSARLCDFGVARLDAAATGSYAFDSAVLRAATPAYASPQILEGLAPTPQDDIYSLAAVAYRLLAGERVFGGMEAGEAMAAGLRPQRVEGLDERAWALLESALSPRREDRPARVEDLAALFADPVPDGDRDGLSDASRPGGAQAEEIRAIRADARPPAAFRLESGRRRYGALRVLGMLIVLAGILAGAAYFYYGEERLEEALDDALAAAGLASQSSMPEPVSAGETAAARDAGGSGEAAGDMSGAADADRQADAVTAAPQDAQMPERGERGGINAAPSQDGDETGADVRREPAAAEGQQALVVTLQLAGAERRPDVATVEVTENEEPVALRLERATSDESVELSIVPITREEGFDPLAELTGLDPSGTIRLPAGVREHTLSIALPDDDIVTGTRRYGFYVMQAVPEERPLARVELRVADDELEATSGYVPPGTVAFAESAPRVTEGEGAASIRIVRMGGVEEERVVWLEVLEDSAVAGEDYVDISGREVRFAPGTDNVTVFVPIVDDSIPEAEERFRIVLEDPDGPIGVPSQMPVRILDDD